MVTSRTRPNTMEEVLDRYPRLTAHMICESLGYFTPLSAANAILHHIRGHAFYCEWYCHMAGSAKEDVLRCGREVINRAFSNRHDHRGFMAHYPAARALVERVRTGGPDPIFMSW